uniref:phosphoribosylaminoimidazolesuccinocarboxamide synthase n=1 Tax=Equus asinus asinus TaxID=83772 RepID=A0A8C4PRU4_EQUAS
MATAEVLNIGKKLYEGKTKEVYELLDSPGKVLLQSKDQITAGNAARKNHLEGKAAISNKITSCIFQLLQEAGKWSVVSPFMVSLTHTHWSFYGEVTLFGLRT